MTLDEGVHHKLGTKRPMQPVKQMTSMRVHINDVLPSSFDGREEWGDLIHPIMDQGDCGSSWAFSTTSMISLMSKYCDNDHVLIKILANTTPCESSWPALSNSCD